MASGSEKYDSALLAVLQNEGKVAPFLDVILGFLYRRTDFFRLMKSENDRLGFPPGVAQKLLMNIFKKYETLACQDAKKVEELKKSREQESKDRKMMTSHSDTGQNSSIPEAVASETVDESLDERGKDSSENEIRMVNKRGELMDTACKVSEETPLDTKPKVADKIEDEEEEEDPEQVRLRRELQENPLTYNGAEREDYFWSQSITEADIRVKMPKTIVKGKQVMVAIKKNHIKVRRQENDGAWCDIIDKDLAWEIDAEESMWTLSPGEFVHINLEKKQERWWEQVFVDEPKINTRKIDCSRPMTDLDDEAQAKIEEMMFNQRQKQLGLPQSHETKTYDLLRKAWDAEGSPFKGQPFDPSKFSVDPSGVVNFNQPSS